MTVHPLSAVLVVLAALIVLQLPALPPPGLAAALAVCVAFCGAVVARRRDGSAVIVFCLCLVPGRALYEAARWQANVLPAACEREPLMLSGRVRGLARAYEQGGRRLWRITFDVHELTPLSCSGPRRVRVYLVEPGEGSEAELGEPFYPGRPLKLKARLRRPWGLLNPSNADGERDYLQRGLHAVGSATLLTERRAQAPQHSPSPWERCAWRSHTGYAVRWMNTRAR